MKAISTILTIFCLTFAGSSAIAQENISPGQAAKSSQAQAIQNVFAFWLAAGTVGGITRAMMSGSGGGPSLGNATNCHH